MDSSRQRKNLILNLALASLIICLMMFVIEATGASDISYKGAADGIDLMGDVYNHVIRDYVKDVDPNEISRRAVEGILDGLDPYSTFLPPVNYTQLQEDSQGEFGGLGIEIQTVGDYPRIMSSPLPDSPAEHVQLRAGDNIIEIDGESTKGMDINEVVSKLRGKVGTRVIIRVERPNHEDPLRFEIKRDRISLKNVPYYGEIEKDIGYIKLSRFNREAAHEMEEALDAIQKNDNLKGVIVDLRGNPGGLLTAAQDIADTFLKKRSLIVFTKGRDERSQYDFYAEKAPTLHPNVPLVLLVDHGSASASEIVAGAIQDHDRGVLIGDTTFGKGSVQTVFDDLPNRAGIKLTTAHYYTPSGRCIHNDRSFEEILEESYGDELDDMTEDARKDSLEKPDKFYTLNRQRVVFGGGGITPDLIVKEKRLGNIMIQLLSQMVFFDFAVTYVDAHPDLTIDFEVTDGIVDEFKSYIADEDVFTYTIPGKKSLDDFKKIIKRLKYNGDILGEIDKLEQMILDKRDADFEANRETIKRFLKREIVAAKFGSRERTVAAKAWDRQMKRAIDLLNNPDEYASLLAEGAKIGIVEKD